MPSTLLVPAATAGYDCRGVPIPIGSGSSAARPILHAVRSILHAASRQGDVVGRTPAALADGSSLAAPEPWPALAMVFTHPQAASVAAPFDADADEVVSGIRFDDQDRARPIYHPTVEEGLASALSDLIQRREARSLRLGTS